MHNSSHLLLMHPGRFAHDFRGQAVHPPELLQGIGAQLLVVQQHAPPGEIQCLHETTLTTMHMKEAANVIVFEVAVDGRSFHRVTGSLV